MLTKNGIEEQKEVSRQLVDVAVECALKVRPFLLDAFTNGISTELKAGYHDIVTEADRSSEKLISEHIFQSVPDSTIIGEEGGRQGGGRFTWHVDPIDGTNNFASGIPLFCVSIAVAEGDQMLAGIVYDPVRDEKITATLDGTFVNGTAVRASGYEIDSKAVLLSGYPYEGGRSTPEHFAFFNQLVGSFRAVRRLGSTALELAYVACGRADLTFQTNANSWDVAAGMFLVQQAGGQYLLPAGSSSDCLAKPWLSPRFIAACPQFVVEKSTVQRILTAPEEVW